MAAQPTEGKVAFEAMANSSSPHVVWIVRENLKKNRLKTMDRAWVERMASR